jgi:hypothetical protein
MSLGAGELESGPVSPSPTRSPCGLGSGVLDDRLHDRRGGLQVLYLTLAGAQVRGPDFWSYAPARRPLLRDTRPMSTSDEEPLHGLGGRLRLATSPGYLPTLAAHLSGLVGPSQGPRPRVHSSLAASCAKPRPRLHNLFQLLAVDKLVVERLGTADRHGLLAYGIPVHEWGSSSCFGPETWPMVKFTLQRARVEAASGRSSMRRDSAPFSMQECLSRRQRLLRGAAFPSRRGSRPSSSSP